jgi:hypothetical protein
MEIELISVFWISPSLGKVARIILFYKISETEGVKFLDSQNLLSPPFQNLCHGLQGVTLGSQ